MVSPVTQEGARSRNVYLPAGTVWTDFWTGKTYDGGQSIEADAPIRTLPLLCAPVPLSARRFNSQPQSRSGELRVYPGADGSFTLYEDEGDNYNYEKGRPCHHSHGME